jgi:predicted DNA-binding ribbon-helix-helix protein
LKIVFTGGLEFMHHERSTDEMKRTTVSFEDDQYEILEKWAEKEVRTVPNLITAIVVSVLRGEAPQVPKLDDDGKGAKRSP